jgi:large subunit ribosomal protein L15e
MGAYKYIHKLFKEHNRSLLKDRIIQWRKSNVVERIERPTNLARARSLGYKAKLGYVIARVRLLRGGRQRPLIKKGRRSKARRRKKIVGKSYQWIAEERANRKFKNCEVIGSYQLAKDGQYYYFEIILGDREILKKYPETKYLSYTRGKTFRGLTSAAKKSRGLRSGKGKGHEKNRPSLRAHGRRGKN